ncbi:hypothetical protein [Wolbachia endosymbiont (group A) of Bombylius major]|nr:hypothetical protein [Wolbachia endosymbiont (group A) of Bombylius major]
MNQKLKKFLVICGHILLFAACTAAWFLSAYLILVVDSFLFGGAVLNRT